MFKETPAACQKQFPPAVCAFLTWGNCFLLTRRNVNMKHFPGYHSLPGGKVNKNESLAQAVSREIQEELAVTIAPSEFQEIGMAITPLTHPYGFQTTFFHYHFEKEPKLTPDPDEFDHCQWINAQDFQDLYLAGDILMVPPIRKLIERFSQNKTLTISNSAFSPPEIANYEVICGLKQFFTPSNTLPPFNSTNTLLCDGIIIDASPKDEATALQLITQLQKEKPRAFFISHFHGDHHQFFPLLSQKLSLPLYIGKQTYDEISKRRPSDYFQSASEIRFIENEQTIGQWNHMAIKVLNLPGHSAEMMCLRAESNQWLFVSDLYVGRTSVVVDNMHQYFESLDQVLKINPTVLIPSHGIATGGTSVIQKIKKHRLYREEQILKLYQQGHSIEKIRQLLYANLDEKLTDYAVQNIKSHLSRLQILGKIDCLK